MSDSKHERDDRAEAVQALMLIREQCADVNAWQVWAANGDLVEAYPNELLDHITALTQRAEAAEAERDVARRETSQLVQDACEGAMVPVSLLDNVKHALHEVDPYNPALLGYAPSFGVWETLMRERDAAREEARENYEDCTVNIALLEKSISERDALRKDRDAWVNQSRYVIERAKKLRGETLDAECVLAIAGLDRMIDALDAAMAVQPTTGDKHE